MVTLSASGDLGIRAVDKDDKVVFFPIDLVDDTPNGLVLGGIPADATHHRRRARTWSPKATRSSRWKPGRPSGSATARHDLNRPEPLVPDVGPADDSDAMDIVKVAINNARLTLSILVFLLVAGALAYQSVPKEAEPDVAIPMIYVSLIVSGHLARRIPNGCCCSPVETQLKSPQGSEGDAVGRLSRAAATSWSSSTRRPTSATRLIDTRNKVQDAKRDLPQEAEEPTVNEINVSEFPVLVVTRLGQRALSAC